MSARRSFVIMKGRTAKPVGNRGLKFFPLNALPCNKIRRPYVFTPVVFGDNGTYVHVQLFMFPQFTIS